MASLSRDTSLLKLLDSKMANYACGHQARGDFENTSGLKSLPSIPTEK
jgi:hypothetical protein